MRNDKPAIVDLSEMQHDHSSAAQGGLIPKEIFFGMSAGIVLASVELPAWTVPKNCTLPAGLTGSVGSVNATTTATADAVFLLLKNGTSIGSVTFPASATAPTFSLSTSVGLLVGDRLSLLAPDPMDTTLGGISVTIKADL